jgi:hypothetical protein
LDYCRHLVAIAFPIPAKQSVGDQFGAEISCQESDHSH